MSPSPRSDSGPRLLLVARAGTRPARVHGERVHLRSKRVPSQDLLLVSLTSILHVVATFGVAVAVAGVTGCLSVWAHAARACKARLGSTRPAHSGERE